MRNILSLLTCIVLVGAPMTAQSAHPLITDDTGTQGKGRFQLEVTGEYGRDRETVSGLATKTTAGQMNATFTAGVADAVDIFVDAPHQWNRTEAMGTVLFSESGVSDVSVGLKWRFFDTDGLRFAFKPVLSLPSGDENKGLGTGKAGYSAFLVVEKEVAPVAVLLNLGYIWNDNKVDAEKDLWHVSLAATYQVVKHLKLATNVGMDKNTDKAADQDPAFALVGIIYSVNGDLDISLGVKRGLNDAEIDTTLLAGVTMRF